MKFWIGVLFVSISFPSIQSFSPVANAETVKTSSIEVPTFTLSSLEKRGKDTVINFETAPDLLGVPDRDGNPPTARKWALIDDDGLATVAILSYTALGPCLGQNWLKERNKALDATYWPLFRATIKAALDRASSIYDDKYENKELSDAVAKAKREFAKLDDKKPPTAERLSSVVGPLFLKTQEDLGYKVGEQGKAPVTRELFDSNFNEFPLGSLLSSVMRPSEVLRGLGGDDTSAPPTDLKSILVRFVASENRSEGRVVQAGTH